MDRPLFDYQRQLRGLLAGAHARIKAEVHGEPETYVRDADADQWAAYLTDKYAAQPPVPIIDHARVEDLGEREVDATGMPGVTFSASEWGGPVIRPGRGVQLVIPVEGDAELLRCGPSGGAPVVEQAAVMDGAVYRTWAWPLVRGNEALDQEIQAVIGQVRDGAAKVAAEVEQHNAGLLDFARQVIEERRAELETHSDFLAGLTIPVQRREEADRPLQLPPLPTRKAPEALTPKPQPVSGPALDSFYEDTLAVVRPMGRSMERTPLDYATRPEERLRDDLLRSLNGVYLGQATAETFNKSGKTDLLLRVQDHNAFIAECKWWSGPKEFGAALDQLFGYSTWRDSRLALIVFVPTRDPAAVVEKARGVVGERPEFDGWEPTPHDRELRCRIRWPEDRGRTATLTVMFFHLPRGNREEAPVASS